MFQATIIGNVGADATLKKSDGNEFYAFRVAHNNRYKRADGTEVDETSWIDVTLSRESRVAPYIKAGTLVYVSGPVSTRVYSSEKDRCMKAGVTVNARQVELLSAKADAVPSRLIDGDGVFHVVRKYFHTDCPGSVLMSQAGRQFGVDDNGWVVPIEDMPEDVASLAGGQKATGNTPAADGESPKKTSRRAAK